MLGTHNLVVTGKNIKFSFKLKRKYTQLCGNTASGKTYLYSLVYLEPTSNGLVNIECDVPVYALPKARYETDLLTVKGCIFIVDEDTVGIYSREFASLLKQSDNYFLLETRGFMTNVPISVEEIYELRTEVDGKFAHKTFYNRYFNNDVIIKPDLFVTEGIGIQNMLVN